MIKEKLLKHSFLLEELIKRDFKVKYKGTVLGILWSVLSPLMMFFVMKMIFTQFFGKSTPHFAVYMLAGNVIYSYFSEATKSGMTALRSNASIISKVTVPKHLFLLSKNVQTFISFLLNLVVFFIYVAIDGISFNWKFLSLIYPIVLLLIFNIGCGFILSTLYMFFMDMRYLYDVALRIIMYMSAIFYTVDSFSSEVQKLFNINPLYLYIKYFRLVVIDSQIPSLRYHALMLAEAVVVLLIGMHMYKKNNNKFLYYI